MVISRCYDFLKQALDSAQAVCGVAGFMAHAATQDLTDILRSMAEVIAHRGSGDEGFYETVTISGVSRVGLAHRCLSVIMYGTHIAVGFVYGRVLWFARPVLTRKDQQLRINMCHT